MCLRSFGDKLDEVRCGMGPKGIALQPDIGKATEAVNAVAKRRKPSTSMQFPARYHVSILSWRPRKSAILKAPDRPIKSLPSRKWRTNELDSRLCISEPMCEGPTTLHHLSIRPESDVGARKTHILHRSILPSLYNIPFSHSPISIL